MTLLMCSPSTTVQYMSLLTSAAAATNAMLIAAPSIRLTCLFSRFIWRRWGASPSSRNASPGCWWSWYWSWSWPCSVRATTCVARVTSAKSCTSSSEASWPLSRTMGRRSSPLWPRVLSSARSAFSTSQVCAISWYHYARYSLAYGANHTLRSSGVDKLWSHGGHRGSGGR